MINDNSAYIKNMIFWRSRLHKGTSTINNVRSLLNVSHKINNDRSLLTVSCNINNERSPLTVMSVINNDRSLLTVSRKTNNDRSLLTVSRSLAPRLDTSTSDRMTWRGRSPACATSWSRGIDCRGCRDWWRPRHAPSHSVDAQSWRPRPDSRSSCLHRGHVSKVETSNFFWYLSKSDCSQNYLSKSKSTF